MERLIIALSTAKLPPDVRHCALSFSRTRALLCTLYASSYSLLRFHVGPTLRNLWSTTRRRWAARGKIWLKRADEPAGPSPIRLLVSAEWRPSSHCTGFWSCFSNGSHPYSATPSSLSAAENRGIATGAKFIAKFHESRIYRHSFVNVCVAGATFSSFSSSSFSSLAVSRKI